MGSEQQTARERIEREVFDSNSATLIYDAERGESPLMARPGHVADRIIAIVKEALLAQSGTLAVSLDRQPGISTKSLHAHHLAIADALDAAFPDIAE